MFTIAIHLCSCNFPLTHCGVRFSSHSLGLAPGSRQVTSPSSGSNRFHSQHLPRHQLWTAVLRARQATGNAYRQNSNFFFHLKKNERFEMLITLRPLKKYICEIPNLSFPIEHIFGLKAIFSGSVIFIMIWFIEMRTVLKSLMKLKGLSPCRYLCPVAKRLEWAMRCCDGICLCEDGLSLERLPGCGVGMMRNCEVVGVDRFPVPAADLFMYAVTLKLRKAAPKLPIE